MVMQFLPFWAVGQCMSALPIPVWGEWFNSPTYFSLNTKFISSAPLQASFQSTKRQNNICIIVKHVPTSDKIKIQKERVALATKSLRIALRILDFLLWILSWRCNTYCIIYSLGQKLSLVNSQAANFSRQQCVDTKRIKLQYKFMHSVLHTKCKIYEVC